MGELTKNLSLREVFGEEIRGWRKFRRALRKEDQELFDQLFDKARLQVDAGGSAGTSWPFKTVLISPKEGLEGAALLDLLDKLLSLGTPTQCEISQHRRGFPV